MPKSTREKIFHKLNRRVFEQADFVLGSLKFSVTSQSAPKHDDSSYRNCRFNNLLANPGGEPRDWPTSRPNDDVNKISRRV